MFIYLRPPLAGSILGALGDAKSLYFVWAATAAEAMMLAGCGGGGPETTACAWTGKIEDAMMKCEFQLNADCCKAFEKGFSAISENKTMDARYVTSYGDLRCHFFGCMFVCSYNIVYII